MTQAAFGLWPTPITAEKAVENTVGLQDVVLDGEDVYWLEMRPSEGGRSALVRLNKEGQVDLLPNISVRTRVHEYGGSCFTVHAGVVFYINDKDQRLYRLEGAESTPLTEPGFRFAEIQFTPLGLLAVGESHVDATNTQNFICFIDAQKGGLQVVAEGHDFYASPALSPDGKSLAYITWNHPNMPWDDTQLMVASIEQGLVTSVQQIDADNPQQAFFQPTWNQKNELFVVSDKSNWWNLYQVIDNELKIVFSVESELGRPLWQLGTKTYGFNFDEIVCTFSELGVGKLWRFNNELQAIPLSYTSFSQVKIHNGMVYALASAANRPTALIRIRPDNTFEVLRESRVLDIDEGYLSIPEHIVFPSFGRTAYAYYYPPKNKDIEMPQGQPPLIVKSHGGPTANSGASLNFEIQYWTSRGFAFLDVNYAGSTGYGRAYRQSLYGQWGIFDIQDCESAALYLANRGLVDKNKLIITGGSAGGFTTLAALAFLDTFHVGSSLYGVGDLESLAKETHKFEAKYLDQLIGPYPEAIQTYHDRSPIDHVDKLKAPIIFFQGDEDKVVPASQAESMIAALKEKGIHTQYFLFEGEQHGFRKAENKIKVLQEQEKFFLSQLRIC